MAKTKNRSNLPAANERSAGSRGTVAPWHPFEGLRRQMERLFDDFDSGFGNLPSRVFANGNGLAAIPAVDVAEKDNAYEITAELPGMDEKNVDVEVRDDFLTISGEKKEEKEEKKKGYHVQERGYGSFTRSFRLPDDVNAARIDARFKKGVLTVTLPKKPGAAQEAKKITVKAA